MGIFSPIRAQLDPDVFQKNGFIRPKTREFILEKVLSVIPGELIYRLLLTGSITTYYSEATSDIDIQVQLIDEEKVDPYSRNIKEMNRSEVNFINRHPVNYFVLPKIEATNFDNLYSGLYDLINNRWIVKSKDRPEGFEERVKTTRPYLGLLKREMSRQIEQVKAYPTLQQAKDVADLFERIDRERKLVYSFGLGVPALTPANVQYKAVEKEFGHIPERIYHLVRKLVDNT